MDSTARPIWQPCAPRRTRDARATKTDFGSVLTNVPELRVSPSARSELHFPGAVDVDHGCGEALGGVGGRFEGQLVRPDTHGRAARRRSRPS